MRDFAEQQAHSPSCRRSGSREALHFYRGSPVHDDDIAWFQCGHEDLFDVSAEALAADRAAEDTGRSETISPERSEERQRA